MPNFPRISVFPLIIAIPFRITCSLHLMFLLAIVAFALKPKMIKEGAPTIGDGQVEVQIGDNVQILSIADAQKLINEYDGDVELISIDGNSKEISMSLNLKEKVHALMLSGLSGTLTINSKKIGLAVANNKNLKLKITTSAQNTKLSLDGPEVTYPLLVAMDSEIGVDTVDVEFTDLKNVKTYDLISYPEGAKLPTINPTGKGYSFDLKTKDAPAELSDGGESPVKIFLNYYEIKSSLSAGAIAGIVIASVVVVAGIVVGIVFAIKHKKGKVGA